MAQASEGVRLVQPTDFDILEEMADRKRYTGSALAQLLDHKPRYMSNRLAHLEDHRLVDRFMDTTMFEITEMGLVALQLRDEYSHDTSREFEELIDETLERQSRQNCNHADSGEA